METGLRTELLQKLKIKLESADNGNSLCLYIPFYSLKSKKETHEWYKFNI